VCVKQDIVFLLDMSGSIARLGNWQRLLDFVTSVIDSESFEVNLDNTRFSVITYDDDAQVEFYLNDYDGRQATIDAVNAITYESGATNIAAAFEKARLDVFTVCCHS
jgi:collagen type VI alpha